MGPPDDYVETIVTCKGDYYDPEFPHQLRDFRQRLQKLLVSDSQKLIVKKVEPWNSVRVTFNIPKDAAVRLQQLAQQGDHALRELGILAVQVEGDQIISLTIAGRNNEKTQLVFRTTERGSSAAAPQPGPSTSSFSSADEASVPGPSNAEATRKNIAHYLSQGGTSVFDSLFRGSGPEVFKSPNVVATHSDPIPFRQPCPVITSSPSTSPSMVGAFSFPPGRTATGYPAMMSPGSGRTPSPVSPGMPPHGVHAMTAQRQAQSTSRGLTSSSPLLVNLLQADMSASHMNNLQQGRMVDFFPGDAQVQTPKKRRRRKPKDSVDRTIASVIAATASSPEAKTQRANNSSPFVISTALGRGEVPPLDPLQQRLISEQSDSSGYRQLKSADILPANIEHHVARLNESIVSIPTLDIPGGASENSSSLDNGPQAISQVENNTLNNRTSLQENLQLKHTDPGPLQNVDRSSQQTALSDQVNKLDAGLPCNEERSSEQNAPNSEPKNELPSDINTNSPKMDNANTATMSSNSSSSVGKECATPTSSVEGLLSNACRMGMDSKAGCEPAVVESKVQSITAAPCTPPSESEPSDTLSTGVSTGELPRNDTVEKRCDADREGDRVSEITNISLANNIGENHLPNRESGEQSHIAMETDQVTSDNIINSTEPFGHSRISDLQNCNNLTSSVGLSPQSAGTASSESPQSTPLLSNPDHDMNIVTVGCAFSDQQTPQINKSMPTDWTMQKLSRSPEFNIASCGELSENLKLGFKSKTIVESDLKSSIEHIKLELSPHESNTVSEVVSSEVGKFDIKIEADVSMEGVVDKRFPEKVDVLPCRAPSPGSELSQESASTSMAQHGGQGNIASTREVVDNPEELEPDTCTASQPTEGTGDQSVNQKGNQVTDQSITLCDNSDNQLGHAGNQATETPAAGKTTMETLGPSDGIECLTRTGNEAFNQPVVSKGVSESPVAFDCRNQEGIIPTVENVNRVDGTIDALKLPTTSVSSGQSSPSSIQSQSNPMAEKPDTPQSGHSELERKHSSGVVPNTLDEHLGRLSSSSLELDTNMTILDSSQVKTVISELSAGTISSDGEELESYDKQIHVDEDPQSTPIDEPDCSKPNTMDDNEPDAIVPASLNKLSSSENTIGTTEMVLDKPDGTIDDTKMVPVDRSLDMSQTVSQTEPSTLLNEAPQSHNASILVSPAGERVDSIPVIPSLSELKSGLIDKAEVENGTESGSHVSSTLSTESQLLGSAGEDKSAMEVTVGEISMPDAVPTLESSTNSCRLPGDAVPDIESSKSDSRLLVGQETDRLNPSSDDKVGEEIVNHPQVKGDETLGLSQNLHVDTNLSSECVEMDLSPEEDIAVISPIKVKAAAGKFILESVTNEASLSHSTFSDNDLTHTGLTHGSTASDSESAGSSVINSHEGHDRRLITSASQHDNIAPGNPVSLSTNPDSRLVKDGKSLCSVDSSLPSTSVVHNSDGCTDIAQTEPVSNQRIDLQTHDAETVVNEISGSTDTSDMTSHRHRQKSGSPDKRSKGISILKPLIDRNAALEKEIQKDCDEDITSSLPIVMKVGQSSDPAVSGVITCTSAPQPTMIKSSFTIDSILDSGSHVASSLVPEATSTIPQLLPSTAPIGTASNSRAENLDNQSLLMTSQPITTVFSSPLPAASHGLNSSLDSRPSNIHMNFLQKSLQTPSKVLNTMTTPHFASKLTDSVRSVMKTDESFIQVVKPIATHAVQGIKTGIVQPMVLNDVHHQVTPGLVATKETLLMLSPPLRLSTTGDLSPPLKSKTSAFSVPGSITAEKEHMAFAPRTILQSTEMSSLDILASAAPVHAAQSRPTEQNSPPIIDRTSLHKNVSPTLTENAISSPATTEDFTVLPQATSVPSRAEHNDSNQVEEDVPGKDTSIPTNGPSTGVDPYDKECALPENSPGNVSLKRKADDSESTTAEKSASATINKLPKITESVSDTSPIINHSDDEVTESMDTQNHNDIKDDAGTERIAEDGLDDKSVENESLKKRHESGESTSTCKSDKDDDSVRGNKKSPKNVRTRRNAAKHSDSELVTPPIRSSRNMRRKAAETPPDVNNTDVQTPDDNGVESLPNDVNSQENAKTTRLPRSTKRKLGCEDVNCEVIEKRSKADEDVENDSSMKTRSTRGSKAITPSKTENSRSKKENHAELEESNNKVKSHKTNSKADEGVNKKEASVERVGTRRGVKKEEPVLNAKKNTGDSTPPTDKPSASERRSTRSKGQTDLMALPNTYRVRPTKAKR